MIRFAVKLNLFIIMQHFQLQVRFGEPREKKLYQELGLEYLSDRRWRRLCRRLVYFTKLLTIKLRLILKNLFHQKELLLIDYELVRYTLYLLPDGRFQSTFSHIAYLNGIYSIQNLKILFLYCPSNFHYYLNVHYLFAPMHRLFIISIILFLTILRVDLSH